MTTTTTTTSSPSLYGKEIKQASRPLPLAKPGEVFTEKEKIEADKNWKEKYHIKA